MIKWIFDRMAAFFGLLLIWPLLIVVAVAIKIEMPDEPVFFRQKRVGQHGCLFTLIKFRTMKAHTEGAYVSVAGGSRVTPLGAFLRKYKIDELPELWNVLIGDMSFVGPRPDVPGYADKLQGADRRILELKPGITGPATLKYRNEEELLATQSDPQTYNDEVIWPDKVRINLAYQREYTFFGDIKIILQTLHICS